MCKANPDIKVVYSKGIGDLYNCVCHPALAIFTLRVLRRRDRQVEVAAVSMDIVGENRKRQRANPQKNCNNPLCAAVSVHSKPVSKLYARTLASPAYCHGNCNLTGRCWQTKKLKNMVRNKKRTFYSKKEPQRDHALFRTRGSFKAPLD